MGCIDTYTQHKVGEAGQLECMLGYQDSIKKCEMSPDMIKKIQDADITEHCRLVNEAMTCLENYKMQLESCSATTEPLTELMGQMANYKSLLSNCERDLNMLKCAKKLNTTLSACNPTYEKIKMFEEMSNVTLEMKCQCHVHLNDRCITDLIDSVICLNVMRVTMTESIFNKTVYSEADECKFGDGDHVLPEIFANQVKSIQESVNDCKIMLKCKEKSMQIMKKCEAPIWTFNETDFTNMTMDEQCNVDTVNDDDAEMEVDDYSVDLELITVRDPIEDEQQASGLENNDNNNKAEIQWKDCVLKANIIYEDCSEAKDVFYYYLKSIHRLILTCYDGKYFTYMITDYSPDCNGKNRQRSEDSPLNPTPAAESDEDSDNEMDTHTPMDTITPEMAQPYYDLFHDDTENEDFDGFESDKDRV
ncbi:hypothetical protein GQR58_024670 [Nymphon striatum]|nr:hypothetical protein GQR58_024670 [Nymphon striatum]